MNNSSESQQIEQIYNYLSRKDFNNLQILLSSNITYWGVIRQELEKNTYSEEQNMAIARLLYRLFNINLIKLTDNDMKFMKKNFNNNSINKKILPIIQKLGKNNTVPTDEKSKRMIIIIKFIDEFMEISKSQIKDIIDKLNDDNIDDILDELFNSNFFSIFIKKYSTSNKLHNTDLIKNNLRLFLAQIFLKMKLEKIINNSNKKLILLNIIYVFVNEYMQIPQILKKNKHNINFNISGEKNFNEFYKLLPRYFIASNNFEKLTNLIRLLLVKKINNNNLYN